MPRRSRAAGLLRRELDGTATADERAELRALVAGLAESTPSGRTERDRIALADEIVRLVEGGEASLSSAERAELRHLFYTTHDPLLTIQVIVKVGDALRSGKKGSNG